ncbi:hypothetical protein D3C77_427140 [compost metagenome]
MSAEAAQARSAQQPARTIGRLQGKACATQCGVEVLRQPLCGFYVVGTLAAQFLHQLAGVDAHRAALGTQASGGAGVDALVLVVAFKLTGIDASTLFRLDIAPHDDALARAEGQPLGRANRLTEPALDAFVDDLVGRRQRLEVLQVQLWIVRQHHTGVEDAGRVEQALELPHQLVGVVAPFQFHKRRHVAASAVFGLERAAVFHSHQLRNVVHEGGVTRHLLR